MSSPRITVVADSRHHRQNIGGWVAVGQISWALETAWKVAAAGYKVRCDWTPA